MKIDRFENLIAWQKAQGLAAGIYHHFKTIQDWGFRDQICRAAVSVSSNIAEGFDRETDKEFIRYLFIARASAAEVKSMLYLAERIGYLDNQLAKKLLNDCEETAKLIGGLIRYLLKSRPPNSREPIFSYGEEE